MGQVAMPARMACPRCRREDQVIRVAETADRRSDLATVRVVGPDDGPAGRDLATALAPRPGRLARVGRPASRKRAGLIFLGLAYPLESAIVYGVVSFRRNRRVRRGLPHAMAVWREGRFCLRCTGAYFPMDADGIPAAIPRGTLLSPPEFQRLVWTAGGYGDLLAHP